MAESKTQNLKAALVAIDEETAQELKEIAAETNLPMVQLMKEMSGILKVALGRKVKIESAKEDHYAMFDFEKFRKLVKLDD